MPAACSSVSCDIPRLVLYFPLQTNVGAVSGRTHVTSLDAAERLSGGAPAEGPAGSAHGSAQLHALTNTRCRPRASFRKWCVSGQCLPLLRAHFPKRIFRYLSSYADGRLCTRMGCKYYLHRLETIQIFI